MPAPTTHALKRIQQRGIPPLMVDHLWRFGTTKRCGGSADLLVFDKASRRRMARQLGREILRDAERWLGTYAVVGDGGQIVTVGHRTKRFRHA